uniref:Uncharacterized protein n=1 Tax=Rhizophora mucronata TaxID=61149 RepID=A0A2P2QQL9_RHIMU
MDSSARVTLVRDKKSGGQGIWITILVVLLAIAAYFLKKKGVLFLA